MKCLLDMHTLMWFINGDDQLSIRARNVIESADENYVSIASLWEIAIKVSLGKLELKSDFDGVRTQISMNGFKMLNIDFDDTMVIANLPFHHRDPFDRLIIAQAMNNQLTIITKDDSFNKYNVPCLW